MNADAHPAESTMIRANALIFPLAIAAVYAGAPAPAIAQQRPPVPVRNVELFRLRGTAFDSITGRPLASATVHIVGQLETRVSDNSGRFQFDSVPAGDQLIIMEHPRLDSLGLPEISLRVRVAPNAPDVALVVPELNTLWSRTCGSKRAPNDSALIYGVVRDAQTRAGLRNSRVSFSWIDIGLKDARVNPKRFTLETRTDSAGSYVACGVPVDVAMELTTHSVVPHGSAGETIVETSYAFPAQVSRIQRRDLLVMTDEPASNMPRGTLRGRITDESGAPFAAVRVLVDGVPVATTDNNGNYTYGDARIGTHSIEFAVEGRPPVVRLIDVTPGNTVLVGARIERLSLELARAQIKANKADELRAYLARANACRGCKVNDSTRLQKFSSMAQVVSSAGQLTAASVVNGPVRFTTASARVSRTCDADVIIDEERKPHAAFWKLDPRDLAYVGFGAMNWQWRPDQEPTSECGQVYVITKWAVAK